MSALTVKSIQECDGIFSSKTEYPLVSLIKPSCRSLLPEAMRFGFYTLWLEKWNCPDSSPDNCSSVFGRSEYDFTDGMLLPVRPETLVVRDLLENISTCDNQCRILCFHPSIMCSVTGNGQSGGYPFFGYSYAEALHMSRRETSVLENEMDRVGEELSWGIDEYSYTLLSDRIRLLLDYISRFYTRQFITRHDENLRIVGKVDKLLDEFFGSGKARFSILPDSETLAVGLGCSQYYLDSMLKHETGKNVAEYVESRRISYAAGLLSRKGISPEEAAAFLGFPTCTAFCRQFRKLNLTPRSLSNPS